MMSLLRAFIWEFIQNVPVLLGFTTAVWWWAREERRKAIVACVMGGSVGALVIRYTEAWKIGRPFMEPWSVTFVNIVGFSLILLLFAIYLGKEGRWSNPTIDLALGVLAGGGFALVQGLAAPGASVVGVVLHSVALAFAASVVMVMIRRLKVQTFRAALVNAALVSLTMTAIITVIDYGYLLIW
jgi:fluoride ion exporter CrcB/FEX